MAIRERKGRASPWQVYWNNPFTGKRECANFQTREEAEKEDSLVKHRLKFERESFRPQGVEDDKKSSQRLTLEQVFFLYLQEKHFTGENLSCQLAHMRLILTVAGNWSVECIGREKLGQIIEVIKKQPLKQVTVHKKMAALRAILNWAAEENICEPIPFPKLEHGYYEKFIPPTPCEIRRMLEVSPPHLARVIIIGSQCGIRVGKSELFKLTWADVDFEMGLIRVKAANKNPKAPWREIPMRQDLKEIMFKWYKEDSLSGISYVIHYKGKQIAKIKSAWMTMLKNAGLNRRIRAYDLRHSFATELIAQGVDIGTIAQLMGHSSPEMIYHHYQYVMDKQKRSAVEALPELTYVPTPMCPNKKGLSRLS